MSAKSNSSSRIFLGGVVEGFYGRPWTMEQRKELFRREQKWGLNTYLYAPKDDYKHRMYWRALYTPAEAEQLIALITAAKEHSIEFIYAISPGLDITFSNPKEVTALKRKLSQVCEFGCRSFALLFDDIETEMCPADKEAFSSFADAQVSVTNQVYEHLQEPQTFLFCPTGRMHKQVMGDDPRLLDSHLSVMADHGQSQIEQAYGDSEKAKLPERYKEETLGGPRLKKGPILLGRLRRMGSNDYFKTNGLAHFLNKKDCGHQLVSSDYCAAFCTPNVSQSSYLHTVGEKLLPKIDVLWTGPKVVSKDISVESIKEVSTVLRRPPVIWDNIHANDYDPQRLFLGPFKNRPTELIPKLRGVLTNPNCEFEPNFVAVHTLATWCKSSSGQKDVAMDGEDQGSDYDPQEALRLALTDWLVEFGVADQPDVSRAGSGSARREPSDEEPMQTDEYVPGPRENPLYTAEPLTLDDLTLLAELFYLPYEYGPGAFTMLQELNWLRGNSDAATFGSVVAENKRAKEWRDRAEHFDQMCAGVVRMFNRLSNAPNRTILYDLYNYICDIKSGISLARTFVNSLGGRNPPPSQVINDDPEPWGFRGGLSGEFQRMLPCHGNRDLYRVPPTTRVYTICPGTPKLKSEVLKLFKEMQSEMLQDPPLIGDRLVEGQISPSKHCDMVLEDETGVCGFAIALIDAKTAMTKAQYPETMLRDYPSLMVIQIHPRVPDPGTTKRLISSMLLLLKEAGSPGVFCEFRSNDRRMLDFLRTLDILHVLKVDGLQTGLVLMGTKL